jgi:small subunit ribosomal protein S11
MAIKGGIKKKKKQLKDVKTARVYVNSTFNNTIISITDDEGNALSWSSAGHLGFKGARKATPYAAGQATENALEKAKPYNIQSYKLFICGIGPGRESAIRLFQTKKLHIVGIKDMTPIPHNGCRPKKPRKV